MNHVAVDVRKAEAAALGGGGEAGVIDAELVQDGGVEVMDVDGTGGEFFLGGIDGLAIGTEDVVAVIVGGSVGHTGLNAAAGHPSGEAARVVIATVVILGELALGIGGAAEFAAPDDERVL